jgi:hypothetical protein
MYFGEQGGRVGRSGGNRQGMEEGAELGMGVGRITHETIKNSIHPSVSLCIWGLNMLVYNVYNIVTKKKKRKLRMHKNCLDARFYSRI